jgi:hypothetical protein
MNNDSFYKDVMNSYIINRYKKEINDTGLMDYLKSNVKIDDKNNKPAIQAYFDNGLNIQKDGHFNAKTLDAFLNKDYSALKVDQIKIDPIEAVKIFKKPELEKLEQAYKGVKIKEEIVGANGIIDQEVSAYPFDQEVKNTIINEMKSDYTKQVDGLNYADVIANYKKI